MHGAGRAMQVPQAVAFELQVLRDSRCHN
jgi:hypothetical protein